MERKEGHLEGLIRHEQQVQVNLESELDSKLYRVREYVANYPGDYAGIQSVLKEALAAVEAVATQQVKLMTLDTAQRAAERDRKEPRSSTRSGSTSRTSTTRSKVLTEKEEWRERLLASLAIKVDELRKLAQRAEANDKGLTIQLATYSGEGAMSDEEIAYFNSIRRQVTCAKEALWVAVSKTNRLFEQVQESRKKAGGGS